MMAGNPNWWSINGMHPQSSASSPHEFLYGLNSSFSSNPSPDDHHHPTQDFPVRSWSQLLMGGLAGGEEERFGASLFQQQKKLENWEDHVLNLNHESNFLTRSNISSHIDHDVKQEVNINIDSQSSPQIYANNHHHVDHEEIIQATTPRHNNPSSWPPLHQIASHHVKSIFSPNSCTTTLNSNSSNNNNNILNFSGTKPLAAEGKNNHHQDHSSHECNSTGGVSKKARVQQSSAQPALKVRKEKLGDRITALHQLVSPFGKTDTASVLSEAIGYIRFLHGQIEALSSPYMRNASGSSTVHHQHSVQERNCLFPEEPGQFLNDMGMDGRGSSKQDSQNRGVKDLRSRGLCLVPISCTLHVGNDHGADYWAPAALGGGF